MTPSHLALTLLERARARGAQVAPRHAPSERAARRIARWRAQPPFSDPDLFAQRLATAGLSEQSFAAIVEDASISDRGDGAPVGDRGDGGPVGERGAAIGDRGDGAPAPWLDLIGSPATLAPALRARLYDDTPLAGLLVAIEPLLVAAVDRIRAATAGLSPSRFDLDAVIADRLVAARPELIWNLGRTLALELNVARLQGELHGDTPEARFADYIAKLRSPARRAALFEEYPVLARQIAERLERLADALVELLLRLDADWDLVAGALGAAPRKLIGVECGGDTHRGGRTVVIARFDSGHAIVYKPRPLAMAAHFQDLIAWAYGWDGPPLRTLGIIDRQDYGWVEYVAAAPCTDPAQIARYYERLGGYLALLYVLGGNDFHFENIIACGEHPMLIDLETVMAPPHPGPDAPRSALSVGILPQRLYADDDGEGVELSGLGGARAQTSPMAVPQFAGVDTDELRVVRDRGEIEPGANVPTLHGESANAGEHHGALARGFEAMYRFAMAHRASMPIDRFAGDEVRVVLRATLEYGVLMRDSFHPDLLRDALDRDKFFDQLWQSAARQSALARVVGHEHRALCEGDVPLFSTRVSSRDLVCDGGAAIAGMFQRSALELARANLAALSEADLARQLWTIRASFASVAMASDRWFDGDGAGARPRPAGDPLAAARAIGDYLCEEAIVDTSGQRAGVSWRGLALARGRHFEIAELSPTLYDGIAGVALFLAELSRATGQARYDDTARAAIARLDPTQDGGATGALGIGGFDGIGGLIYAYAQLGATWSDAAVVERAVALARQIPARLDGDRAYDVISGAAGCIGGLLALHAVRPRGPALAIATACGDHLVARSIETADGRAWIGATANKAVAGFSHGQSGIAWALGALFGATGQSRFRDAAASAVRLERTLFDPALQNWPNNLAAVARDQHAWCHGAPGVGLARLALREHLRDPELDDDLAVAIETTRASGFSEQHCLCHGNLGNLELLLEAERRAGRADLRGAIAHQLDTTLADIRTRGWHCGVPLGVETPGLLTGVAGIGYALLRHLDPTIPSVLTLAPPA